MITADDARNIALRQPDREVLEKIEQSVRWTAHAGGRVCELENAITPLTDRLRAYLEDNLKYNVIPPYAGRWKLRW